MALCVPLPTLGSPNLAHSMGSGVGLWNIFIAPPPSLLEDDSGLGPQGPWQPSSVLGTWLPLASAFLCVCKMGGFTVPPPLNMLCNHSVWRKALVEGGVYFPFVWR